MSTTALRYGRRLVTRCPEDGRLEVTDVNTQTRRTTSLTRKTIREDIGLREPASLLWRLREGKPEIRQIYGHLLPPPHRKLVRGLVAKDFNFPAAYHSILNSYDTEELDALGERLATSTIVSIDASVRLRADGNGVVVYTPYFNGFYANSSAYGILRRCERGVSIGDIVSRCKLDGGIVTEFIARAITLGIVRVRA